jgi:uncharacterized protein YerC
MTRVSRYKLHQEDLDEIVEYFTYLINTLREKKEIESFLTQFLTKEEKIMLAKRLVLFMMIKKGYSVEIIKASLHISYETIRTYTYQFSSKDQQFYKIIDRLLQREKSKVFWKKIDKLFKPLELTLNSKTSMKARAKFLSGDY